MNFFTKFGLLIFKIVTIAQPVNCMTEVQMYWHQLM